MAFTEQWPCPAWYYKHMGRLEKTLVRALPFAGLGVLLLARFGLTTHAAAPAVGSLAPMPVEAPKFVTYESGAAQWLSAPRSVELSQGVTFGQDDATLKTSAAVALLDKAQNLVSAQAQGAVTITDPQDNLTGLHGSIDFTHHLAKLSDNVVLVVKPGKRETDLKEGSPRKQFKDPATLTCALMTYDYRRKIGRVPGALTVTQVVQTKDGAETRVLTADAGLYNGKAQTIQLVGDIHVTNSDGTKINADTRPSGKPIVIGTKEGEEYIRVPFPTKGIFPNKSGTDTEPDSGKDDAADTDLTVPPAPPATNRAGASPAPTDSSPVPLPAATP